jgi:hypothetical protein
MTTAPVTVSCSEVEEALIDEAMPRPPGFEAHLRDCASCRGFRKTQAGALLLRGAAPVVARREVPAWFSLDSWAVRGAAAAVACGAALLFWGGALLAPPVLTEAPPPPAKVAEAPDVHVRVKVSSPTELPVELEAPPVDGPLSAADAAQLRALASLSDGVVAVAHRELVARDELYRPFGSLALWVAPETTHPLRSLGRVVHPIVSTSED